MARMLGLAYGDRLWRYSMHGKEKSQARRAQRAHEHAEVERTPCDGGAGCRCCDCRSRCSTCLNQCLGGHANYLDAHVCAELHHWNTAVE